MNTLTEPIFFKSSRAWPLHLLCWSAFIAAEILLVRYIVGRYDKLLTYLIFYGLSIGLFYGYTSFLFPAVTRTTFPAIGLMGGLLLALITYTCCSLAAKRLLFPTSSTISMPVVLGVVYRGVYFAALAAAYWFPIQSWKKKSELVRLEKEYVRTQNAYLQAKLQPHLLFNSLNFLHDLTYESAPAGRCIHLLADVLRFSMQETDNEGTVELDAELRQIRNYIDLYQLRASRPLQLTYELPDAGPGVRIIPLVLLSLVENMFHHGNLTNSQEPAYLHISYTNGLLRFRSSNDTRQGGSPAGTGLGLSNNRIRLEARYPGSYLLETFLSGSRFQVNLDMNLA